MTEANTEKFDALATEIYKLSPDELLDRSSLLTEAIPCVSAIFAGSLSAVLGNLFGLLAVADTGLVPALIEQGDRMLAKAEGVELSLIQSLEADVDALRILLRVREEFRDVARRSVESHAAMASREINRESDVPFKVKVYGKDGVAWCAGLEHEPKEIREQRLLAGLREELKSRGSGAEVLGVITRAEAEEIEERIKQKPDSVPVWAKVSGTAPQVPFYPAAGPAVHQ